MVVRAGSWSRVAAYLLRELWLGRRLHRGSHRHDVRSSERGHAVSAVDVGVGPWKGPGRERRAGGSAVAFDEFIKPADDGERLD
jgi:hypothetical protein